MESLVMYWLIGFVIGSFVAAATANYSNHKVYKNYEALAEGQAYTWGPEKPRNFSDWFLLAIWSGVTGVCVFGYPTAPTFVGGFIVIVFLLLLVCIVQHQRIENDRLSHHIDLAVVESQAGVLRASEYGESLSFWEERDMAGFVQSWHPQRYADELTSLR